MVGVIYSEIYVPDSGRRRYREISGSLSGASVLVVSERQLGDPGLLSVCR